ncbi:hypothetical protein Tco_1355153 [Tanacetum coccineum]
MGGSYHPIKDTNLKLLRSLPSAWNNIALIMLNKADLDELRMDDLYNNLKVYGLRLKSNQANEFSKPSECGLYVILDDTSSTPTVRDQTEDLSNIEQDDLKRWISNCRWPCCTMRQSLNVTTPHKRGHLLENAGHQEISGNRNEDLVPRMIVTMRTPANAFGCSRWE